MGKKRKASGASSSGPKGPKDFDPKDSRLPAVTTFEDIADSEEEYFLNQEQILFNDAPQSKKQKRLEEESKFMEDSEEEIFEQDSEDEDEDDEVEVVAPKSKKGSKKRRGADSESEVEAGNEEEQESGWWGSSRKEYYLNDAIQTEEDALMEEQEAIRLQKKKLAKMSEDDFIFNEDTWLTEKTDDADENEVVTEKLVLNDVDISDLSTEERIRLLHSRYPELDYLAEELLELQPLLVTLQEAADGQTRKSVAVVKYRILGCYVATLAFYFATLTSPIRDSGGASKALDPAELRDHEVMGTLLECREAWQQVKDLKASKSTDNDASMLSPDEEDAASILDADELSAESTKKTSKDKTEKKKSKKAERQARELEDSLADLSSLVTAAKKSKKIDKPEISDNHSDFGEEETLNSRAAAEKAARKKSLRFYTSQIVQKANKRAGAGAAAGGDVDIPYRERLKDRQARLNAEAANRGKKNSSAADADLGNESDDEDRQVANAVKDDEDEYYDMVTSKKKAQKALKSEALEAAGKREWIGEEEEVGKRAIGRTIMKNQGLAPKRKKDVRNPRVKKRVKYEKQKKKLSSMKAVYKGGEGKGGYGGEKTGIKSGLIKSVKL